MIPLRDLNPTRRFPIATVALVSINVLVFLYQVTLDGADLSDLINTAGVIPYQVTHSLGIDVVRDLFTSMFLHGGWMHLLSNMLYLWIFGDNIEDRLGSIRFTVFYIVCGVVAVLVQAFVSPDTRIPTIGASGAIAGVLGAYLVLFPNARVQSLMFFFYFVRFVEIPAIIVLGLWFVLQFFDGLAALNLPRSGGVAYFAHIGGFLAGVALVFVFRLGTRPPPPQRRARRADSVFEDEFPDLWQ